MTKVRFGRVVRLVREKANPAKPFRIGLEAIESGTGRLVSEPVTDYAGPGTAFVAGDLLFGKLRPYLSKAWLADRDGAAVGDFHVYRPTDRVHPGYLRWVLLARNFLGPVVSSVFGAKMPRADWEFIRNVEIYVPSMEEQRAIAGYLDRETARINTLIEEQQRLIETLRERRHAVVDRLIRRGVGNARMIDSGDPLVGAIPEGWSIMPIRRVATSLDSQRIPLSSEQRAERVGPIPYYGATSVIDYVDDYIFDESLVLVAEDGFGLLYRSKPIAVHVAGQVWVNNHAHVLRPIGVPAWLLAARIESESLVPYIVGSRQPKLTAEALMGMRISLPPEKQWSQIRAVLDDETAKTDSLIEATERFIELARERREALITAAMTGQIDVRRTV